jgi:hypothetical protein
MQGMGFRRRMWGWIVRVAVLLPLMICLVAWPFSYSQPSGLARAWDDFLIVDSAGGCVSVVRCKDLTPFLVRRVPPAKPIWKPFWGSCEMADYVVVATVQDIGHRVMGFGFGTEPKLKQGQWILDSDGNAVFVADPVTEPASDSSSPAGPFSFRDPNLASMPTAKHFHFAVVLPWWSLTVGAILIALAVWVPYLRARRKAPSADKAFPVG